MKQNNSMADKNNTSADKTTCGNNNNRGRNNKHKGKGRSNSKDGKYNPHKDEKLGEAGDVNNPSYYYEDANVLDQVMNFSFNEFGGVPFGLDFNTTQYPSHNIMIATYALNPSIPQTTSLRPYNMDGATTAALRNFLALSGSNAKTTTYAPQDVVILTLAIAELIKTTTYLARAFGVAYLFNYRNRSYPDQLIEAMGINAADFQRNLADYRVRFNKLLSIASKIPFPADIPAFRKAADLYAYIYLDDPNSALAQTYLFVPNSTWLFDEAYDPNGAGLKTFQVADFRVVQNMSVILDNFETMISALVNSTSLNSIYSDIMRLVQNGKITKLITFNSIPENFVVVPTYNEEVRDWIHNAFIMGAPLATASQYYDSTSMEPLTDSNDISCDANTNRLLYHPQFLLPNGPFGYEALIDFTHDNVSIEEKVRATRLSQRCTYIEDTNTSTWYSNDLAFADEYVVDVFYYTGEDGNLWLNVPYSFDDVSRSGVTPGYVCTLSNTLSKFDWAPMFYWKVSGHIETIGDLDYYTKLDYKTLKKIYDYEIIHFLQIG